MSRFQIFSLLAAFIFYTAFVAAVSQQKGLSPFPRNLTGFVPQTARYLLKHGALSQPEYGKLYAELQAASRANPELEYAQDVFTLAGDGRTLLPKHPLLAAVLSAPFYALFGNFGFWLFNQAALFLLLAGTGVLCLEFAGPAGAYMLLALTPLLTDFFRYSYNFHYDLLGAAFVVWGFAGFIGGRRWAGPVFALALFIRLTHAAFAPAVLLTAARKPRKGSTAFILWISFGMLALLVLNHALWGEAVMGPYGRMVRFRGGEPFIEHGTHYFSLRFLAAGAYARLFGPVDGVLREDPVLLLAPLGVFFSRGRARFRGLLALTSASALYLVLMLCWPFWEGTGGTRLVLPAVALAFPAAALVIERVINALTGRR